MWIPKLDDVFKKYRKYVGTNYGKLNPEDEAVNKVLLDFANYMMPLRYWAEGQQIHQETQEGELLPKIDMDYCKVKFLEWIKMWLRNEAPSTIHRDGKSVPENLPFEKCKNSDEQYKVVLQFLDKAVAQAKVMALVVEPISIRKLKLLFDAYRVDVENRRLHRKVLYAIEQVAISNFFRGRGRPNQKNRREPIVWHDKWNYAEQARFIIYFQANVLQWLEDEPCFSAIDPKREIKVEPYDSFKDTSWFIKVLMKLFDHAIYAFKKMSESEAVKMVEFMRGISRHNIIEPFHSIDGGDTAQGKFEGWQHPQLKARMRRDEIRLIKRIEGDKDLQRELEQVNNQALREASGKTSYLELYLQENSYKVCWGWMLRNPNSALWDLLGFMTPETFEIFFATARARNLQLEFPDEKSIHMSFLQQTVRELRRMKYSREEMAGYLNRYYPAEKPYTAIRVKYLLKLDREWQRLSFEEGSDVGYDYETIYTNRVHKFSTWFHYLKSKIQKLIKYSKSYKEDQLDVHEPPASFYAIETFVQMPKYFERMVKNSGFDPPEPL